MDVIRIGHIKIYIDRNFRHVLHSFVLVMYIICIGHITHSFVLVMDILFIGHITRYLARNFHPIFHIYLYSVSGSCSNSEKASADIYYFPVYIQYLGPIFLILVSATIHGHYFIFYRLDFYGW